MNHNTLKTDPARVSPVSTEAIQAELEHVENKINTFLRELALAGLLIGPFCIAACVK